MIQNSILPRTVRNVRGRGGGVAVLSMARHCDQQLSVILGRLSGGRAGLLHTSRTVATTLLQSHCGSFGLTRVDAEKIAEVGGQRAAKWAEKPFGGKS